MAINENWARWIMASLHKHFDDNRQGLILYVDGQIRDTRTESEYIEVRVDGPNFTEISKNNWKIFVEVNVLVSVTMDNKDLHRLVKYIGIVSAAFIDIMIYKYGDGASELGCMRLLQDTGTHERVQVSNFGVIDPAINLQQATVEGHYELLLEI